MGVSRRLANSCFFSRGIFSCITPMSFCDLMMSLDFGGQSEHLVVLLLVVDTKLAADFRKRSTSSYEAAIPCSLNQLKTAIFVVQFHG